MFGKLARFCLPSLLAASTALAQTPAPRIVSLTLVPPTTYEDGSQLNCAVAPICAYNVYRGTCNGGVKTRVVTNSTTLPITVPNSLPGQCFTASTVVSGAESAQSPEARYRGQPGAPAITVVITVAVETQQP